MIRAVSHDRLCEDKMRLVQVRHLFYALLCTLYSLRIAKDVYSIALDSSAGDMKRSLSVSNML